MNIKFYHLDTFTDTLFSGNPAGVCILDDSWLPDSVMQNIAMENNVSETAFCISKNSNYEIRWFTPAVEVDLCGHATLATAYILFNIENYKENEISFNSKSGILKVRKDGEFLTLNFPKDDFKKVDISSELKDCFNFKPLEVFKGKTDYMLVFESEEQIKNIIYDLEKIEKIEARGVIITAKGNEVDFVSRFFAPQSGVDEDPVTGSAHATLISYWSKALNKKEMRAIQLSKRGGFLLCKDMASRVEISGKALIYLEGEIVYF